MIIDLNEITRAWITSYFATEEEKELAQKRYEICLKCPSLKEKHIPLRKKHYYQCGECGCPIKKKIYSPKYNPCPLKKWDVSDNEHPSIFQKDKKNVI